MKKQTCKPACVRLAHASFGSSALVALLGASTISCDPNHVIEVRVLADGAPGSLRAALDAANAETGGAVRIDIRPGTYELTRCATSPQTNEDANVDGDLDVTTDIPVTLSAPDGNVVIYQTCGGERVLDAHGSGTLILSNVTLAGGNVSDGPEAMGGGVRSVSDVVLDRATIRDNRVTAYRASGQPTGGSARGGGLYVGGSLVATGATLQLNTAAAGVGANADASDTNGAVGRGGLAEGGGAYVLGTVRIVGGTIDGNRAVGGRGGSGNPQGAGGEARGGGIAQALGPASSGEASLEGTELTDNTALGGAIANPQQGGATAGTARGGALIVPSKATLVNVTATRNRATSSFAGTAHGGAVEALEVDVSAGVYYANAAIVTSAYPHAVPSPRDPNTTALGGAIRADRVSAVSALFSHNAASQGGAVAAGNADMNDVTASDNTAGNCGGALFASGQLTVNRSRISENVSVACGGGMAADTLVLTDTTVFGNRVSGGAQTTPEVVNYLKPLVPNPAGAGAFAETRVEGRRVTFANNRFTTCSSLGTIALVPVLAQGGGLAASSIELVNATVVDNPEPPGGCVASSASFAFFPPSALGIYAEDLSLNHATVSDAIIATRLVTHHSALLGGINLGSLFIEPPPGTIEQSSYNFFSGGGLVGAGPGDQNVPPGTPLLQPLSDNGGSIPTRAPTAGSPLIDYVPAAQCGATDDARGVSRPQGAACDVGAVEIAP